MEVAAATTVEVERPGRRISLELPFPLLDTSVITMTGGADATIDVGEHLRASVGRYWIMSRFDPGLFPNGAGSDPRQIDVMFLVGPQAYPGMSTLGPSDIRVGGSWWFAW